MKIDAHQHYWKLDRGDYGWLTPDPGVLYRDYLPADLTPQLKQTGIDRTIVVQAAPTLAETEYLLELCEQEPTLAGVVGWLDLESEDFSAQLERLSANPYFLGLRPMLQDMNDDTYILRPRVIKSLGLMADRQTPLDILVFPRHLTHIKRMLEQVPGLRAVIDHLAKPSIAEGTLEPWSTDIARIAGEHPGVYCKLSGMVTEANHTSWKQEDFVPYVHHIVASFGTERILFGSDWPVCLLAASYQEVVALLESVLPEGMEAADKEKLFGANAAAFYKVQL